MTDRNDHDGYRPMTPQPNDDALDAWLTADVERLAATITHPMTNDDRSAR